jgi:hypothetical protein
LAIICGKIIGRNGKCNNLKLEKTDAFALVLSSPILFDAHRLKEAGMIGNRGGGDA